MRRLYWITGMLLMAVLTCSKAEIIAQWDFNSVVPDDNTSTGTVLPSIGSGAVSVVGGTTAVFAPGSANDPTVADNTAWNTSGYPAQGSNNKTAGLQFNLSTAGFSNIVISWEHKVSSSASKYCRLQYSPDGLNFREHPEPASAMAVSSSASVFESLSRSLEDTWGVADNPRFSFRIVTEFESTATASGTNGYVTTFTTNNYSRSGTIRFDMVTVTGRRMASANSAPYLSNIPRVTSVVGEIIPTIPITIWDLESPAEDLSLSVSSSNPLLVPNNAASTVFGGSGSHRTLRLFPTPGIAGVALITVTVSDGTNRVGSAFPLVVLPSASVIFYDSFTYANGPLLTRSANLWDHRAGAYAQCEVVEGQLQISSSQTEDVLAPLLSGPCRPGSDVTIYAAFKIKFLSLPKSSPGYFAHFADGNILRARIFASSASSLPGCFKLLISNGSDSTTLLPWNLHTNTTYTLITRYDIDSARATLWVNPRAESDAGFVGPDVLDPVTITAYGFRQDSQLGSTVLIDDLRVGLYFAAVLLDAPAPPNPLTIEERGGLVILRWAIAGFHLESALTARGEYVNVLGANSPYTNKAYGPAAFFRLSRD
jgi:hypothetical protein